MANIDRSLISIRSPRHFQRVRFSRPSAGSVGPLTVNILGLKRAKLRYSPTQMRIHRYTQWDGTQEILFPTTDDIINHLSDHLLEEEGVRRALRDMMRRGFTSEDGQRSVKGMRDFLRQADEKRRELLNKYSPDSFKLTPEEQQKLSEKLNSRRQDWKPTMSRCATSWSACPANSPTVWTNSIRKCRRPTSAIKSCSNAAKADPRTRHARQAEYERRRTRSR